MGRTRRTFLEAAAVAAVTGAAGCGGAGIKWRTFSEEEARTLEALLERIIPSDDGPGAREAGVIHYIDRQLAGRYREHRKTYRDGLAAAARIADPAQLERDPATRPFFDLVVAHAMQGFYGNPRHGGNRDFASWRMLGIPPLPVRGRDRNAKG